MQSSLRHSDRAALFTVCLLLINLVGDGGSQSSAGLLHQCVLLPVTALFLFLLTKLLFLEGDGQTVRSGRTIWSPSRAFVLAACFEVASAALFRYQGQHFAAVGYGWHPFATGMFFLIGLGLLLACAFRNVLNANVLFAVVMLVYLGGLVLALVSFPLTYLRSDMLPVIQWAGSNLLHGIDPYNTIYVAHRVYDFPYLPGMIVVYLPFVAAHVDLRVATLVFNTITATILFRAASPSYRREVAALLALFFLGPFLQYRHELYTSPHWLTMAAAFILMQRRRFLWAGFATGIGLAIYQFSWILFPFLLLNAYRRRNWMEVFKVFFAGAAGALLLAGPFLPSAAHRILAHTVVSWGQALHADAQAMNFSYWVTYLIHPSQLLKLQAFLMAILFAYCVIKRCCDTVEDTLRWMTVALTIFILLNVLVDGYFYLMLLVPLFAYVCVANSWWRTPETAT